MKPNRNRSAGKLPAVDSLRCSGCNKCIEVCTRKAILKPLNTSCAKCVKYCMTMQVPCTQEHIIFNYERCDSCGLCVSACPQKAIYWLTGDRPVDDDALQGVSAPGMRQGYGKGGEAGCR